MSIQQQIEIETETESANPENSSGWGVVLRETRIRRGLSIDNVSTALHFEIKLIDAIEAEDQERLPGPSFVKGYLRNYAKFLDIDSEPVVRAYSQVCGNDASNIKQVVKIKEVSSKDAAPRYATWLVVIILFVSVGIWWRSELLSPSIQSSVGSKPVVEQAFLVAPEVPAATESEAGSEEGTVQDVPGLMADEPPPAVIEEKTVAGPAISTIKLSLKEDSWIEINDAQGKRLFMDMARAGQTRIIEGEAPFKVLLGNASGVTVEYNGEVYDHTTHDRKGIARFTLGE